MSSIPELDACIARLREDHKLVQFDCEAAVSEICSTRDLTAACKERASHYEKLHAELLPLFVFLVASLNNTTAKESSELAMRHLLGGSIGKSIASVHASSPMDADILGANPENKEVQRALALEARMHLAAGRAKMDSMNLQVTRAPLGGILPLSPSASGFAEARAALVEEAGAALSKAADIFEAVANNAPLIAQIPVGFTQPRSFEFYRPTDEAELLGSSKENVTLPYFPSNTSSFVQSNDGLLINKNSSRPDRRSEQRNAVKSAPRWRHSHTPKQHSTPRVTSMRKQKDSAHVNGLILRDSFTSPHKPKPPTWWQIATPLLGTSKGAQNSHSNPHPVSAVTDTLPVGTVQLPLDGGEMDGAALLFASLVEGASKRLDGLTEGEAADVSVGALCLSADATDATTSLNGTESLLTIPDEFSPNPPKFKGFFSLGAIPPKASTAIANDPESSGTEKTVHVSSFLVTEDRALRARAPPPNHKPLQGLPSRSTRTPAKSGSSSLNKLMSAKDQPSSTKASVSTVRNPPTPPNPVHVLPNSEEAGMKKLVTYLSRSESPLSSIPPRHDTFREKSETQPLSLVHSAQQKTRAKVVPTLAALMASLPTHPFDHPYDGLPAIGPSAAPLELKTADSRELFRVRWGAPPLPQPQTHTSSRAWLRDKVVNGTSSVLNKHRK